MVVFESFLEQFDYNFDRIKDLQYQQVPREHHLFVRTESMTRPFVKRSYMGGMGMPVPNRDYEPIPYDVPVKGPTALFTPTNYRLGYQIERTLVEDEQWGLLASRPSKMLQGAVVLQDMKAADLLNNGFTSQSYDFGGKPLFATDHTREDNLDTWANRIETTLPITVETVFNAIVTLLYNLKDTRGYAIPYNGNINILVPAINATLWQQAVEVVNSVMNPGTTDNKINALTKTFRLTAHPLRYLTNPDAWFITWDPSTPDYGLVLMNRTEPEISPLEPFNGNRDVYHSRLRMRFVAGYENKRGVAGILG